MTRRDTARTDRVFAALADPTRRDLYLALVHDGPSTPTNLASTRKITRQAVSKHLALLEAAGLVGSERQGREVLYTAALTPLTEVTDWLDTTGAAWERRLDALRRLFTQS